jgi:hypothetical protein
VLSWVNSKLLKLLLWPKAEFKRLLRVHIHVPNLPSKCASINQVLFVLISEHQAVVELQSYGDVRGNDRALQDV